VEKNFFAFPFPAIKYYYRVSEYSISKVWGYVLVTKLNSQQFTDSIEFLQVIFISLYANGKAVRWENHWRRRNAPIYTILLNVHPSRLKLHAAASDSLNTHTHRNKDEELNEPISP
jgi:hypothetical protein